MNAESLGRHLVCKRVSMLCRRADMTTEDFRAYWSGPHAKIAREIPGIARYTQNRAVDCLWSLGPDGYDCDGLVELEFQDEAAMLVANSDETVQQRLPQDELQFLKAITLCQVTKGAQQVMPNLVKVILAVRWREPERGSDSLNSIAHSKGCVGCTQDTVASAFHRTHLGYEKKPPHQFASFWFESEHWARIAFSDGTWRSSAPYVMERASAWLMDPLAIVA
jgi:hypothetical protein